MVSDCSKPRLCRLLLRSYFNVPPACPSHHHTSLRRIVHFLTCLLTLTFLPPYMIIRPPSFPLYPSYHTISVLSHHGVIRSTERYQYMMPLPHLLSSLHIFPLPADLPYRHACRVTVTSSHMHLPKYILRWTSIGHPPPPASTMGPVSAPPPVYPICSYDGS